ncbi:MAG: FAD-binding protein [Bacteroidia bacterium]|nr:FAD-binding protein [Bacteroidia bacterium]
MQSNPPLNQLSDQLEGELHSGALIRSLYATDASVYRELPLAVALPKNELDIRLIIAFANEHKLSIIPRAAGTSLAGQCVGNGIVVDISKYMNRILEINEEEAWVRVQPGVVRDQLNEILQPHGLFFGPNTSTSNRCNIGGMVGNNSCGTTSIVYGSTREHVLELKTILSNGEVATFKEGMDNSESDNPALHIHDQVMELLSDEATRELIKERYPSEEVTRRNTGYALDALLRMKPFDPNGPDFNLCSLLCGSEGTLAFTTEIKLNLVPLPKPHDVVLAAHFNSIDDCLKATVIAMDHNPTACELMDKTILDCTKDNIEQSKNRFFIEGDPAGILMIEFRSESDEEAIDLASELTAQLKENELGYAFPIVKGSQTASVWSLRNAGLGVLANIPGDKKAVACIEDTAVAVKDLPQYISEFSGMMKSFNQEAVYYAHAGAGELHLRPVLNLKKSEDVKNFRTIAQASAELVKRYNGSLSGEHGDGKVRAEFIPLVLGEEVYQLLKQLKSIFDPNGIFNPGKIVDPEPMDTGLRYEPDRDEPVIRTKFNFEETGGILRTVEKCNGSGDCRKLNFAGGTMCPSYRATMNETDTTRGRANVLREFLTMNVKENPFDHPEIKEAMDLCLSCKGCKSECPSNIDMATLKSEFLYQYHKSNSVKFSSRITANNSKINGWLSPVALVVNSVLSIGFIKNLIGISPKRNLPKLKRKTFKNWFRRHKQDSFERKVYLFCDEYTNYYDVEIGKKAVLLLNALGYEVLMVDHAESGRAFISKGFLDEASDIATKNVKQFAGMVSEESPLIGIEPSAILSFRDEYPNLVDVELKATAKNLAKNVFLIDEFLSYEYQKGHIDLSEFNKENKHIKLHAHCHQKALANSADTLKMLSIPENYQVEMIPSGCCGMAGSFGYEKDHYDLSMAIGQQVLFPGISDSKNKSLIAANGTSCRHQIMDGTNTVAFHPVEILFDALLVEANKIK